MTNSSRAPEIASPVVKESGASQPLANFLHVKASLDIFRTAVELSVRRETMLSVPPRISPGFTGKILGVTVKVREPAGVVAAGLGGAAALGAVQVMGWLFPYSPMLF